ncbi:MAG: CvpA family protein [Candidatus Zixiibacteriota bacterium]|jgi:membrane protein required for colicin V production
MRSLNWVDVVLAIIVAANCVMGLRRGILREVFNLGGIILGLFAGLRSYEALGWSVEGWLDAKPGMGNLIAFAVVFCVIAAGVSWLGHVLHKGAKRLFVGWFDRLAGGAFGAARGIIFASVVALILALFPFFPKLERDLGSSFLGPHVVKVAPALYGAVMKKIRGEGYEGLDVKKLIDDYLKSDEKGTTDEGGPEDLPADEFPPLDDEEIEEDGE